MGQRQRHLGAPEPQWQVGQHLAAHRQRRAGRLRAVGRHLQALRRPARRARQDERQTHHAHHLGRLHLAAGLHAASLPRTTRQERQGEARRPRPAGRPGRAPACDRSRDGGPPWAAQRRGRAWRVPEAAGRALCLSARHRPARPQLDGRLCPRDRHARRVRHRPDAARPQPLRRRHLPAEKHHGGSEAAARRRHAYCHQRAQDRLRHPGRHRGARQRRQRGRPPRRARARRRRIGHREQEHAAEQGPPSESGAYPLPHRGGRPQPLPEAAHHHHPLQKGRPAARHARTLARAGTLRPRHQDLAAPGRPRGRCQAGNPCCHTPDQPVVVRDRRRLVAAAQQHPHGAVRPADRAPIRRPLHHHGLERLHAGLRPAHPGRSREDLRLPQPPELRDTPLATGRPCQGAGRGSDRRGTLLYLRQGRQALVPRNRPRPDQHAAAEGDGGPRVLASVPGLLLPQPGRRAQPVPLVHRGHCPADHRPPLPLGERLLRRDHRQQQLHPAPADRQQPRVGRQRRQQGHGPRLRLRHLLHVPVQEQPLEPAHARGRHPRLLEGIGRNEPRHPLAQGPHRGHGCRHQRAAGQQEDLREAVHRFHRSPLAPGR